MDMYQFVQNQELEINCNGEAVSINLDSDECSKCNCTDILGKESTEKTDGKMPSSQLKKQESKTNCDSQECSKCNWTEYLGKEVTVEIDREKGSLHPKWKFEYKQNYGFIPGVISGDGEELDAYVLGVDKAVKKFTGTCIAIIHRLHEDDDKLIVVPKGTTFTNEEIIEQTEFQEKFFKSIIIR